MSAWSFACGLELPFAFIHLLKVASPQACADQTMHEDIVAFCDCIKTSLKDNFILRTEWHQKSDVSEHTTKSREKYTERFFNVYTDKLFMSTFQKQILFGNDQKSAALENSQTCSPTQMSEKFKSNAKAYYKEQKIKVGDLIKQNEKEYKKLGCHPNSVEYKCGDISNKLQKWKEELSKSISSQVQTLCAQGAGDAKKVNEKISGLSESKGKKTAEEQILVMIDWYKKNKRQDKVDELSVVLNNLRNLNPTIDAKEETSTYSSDNVKDAGCSKVGTELEASLTSFYADFEVDQAKVGTTQAVEKSKPTECSPNDPLCKGVDEFNKKILSKVGDKLKPENNTSCYTFAEFLTLKSMPSDDLVSAFNSMSPDEIGNLLQPKYPKVKSDSNHDLQQERVSFLKNNPIIDKLITDPKLKNKLANGLKQLAQNFKGSEADKLDAYLKFLKGDVKDALETSESKTTDKLICDDLASTYTGIQVADNFPVEGALPSDDARKKLSQCKVTEDSKLSISNIEKTLMRNRKFLVNGDVSIVDQMANDEKKFQEFKDSNCKDFDKYAQKSCKDGITDKCREGFGPRKARVAAAFRQNTIASVLSSAALANVERVSQIQFDDKKFENWYDKNIRKNQKKAVIAFSGEEDKFDDRVAHNQEVVSNARPPVESTPAVNRAPAFSPTTSDYVTPTKNSEKIVSPDWVKDLPDAPVSIADIQSARSVDDLLTQDETKTFKEREADQEKIRSELIDVRKDLDELDKKSKVALNKRIDELEKQLDQKKLQEVKFQKEANLTPQSIPPQSFFNGMGGSGPSVSSFSNVGGNFFTNPEARISTKAMSQQRYNKAVLSMYESKNPGVTEVKTESGLVVQSIPANSDAAFWGLNVAEMKPSEDEFKDFVNQGQEKLADYLFKNLSTPYEELLVDIVNPSTKEVIRVHVFKDKDGFKARPFTRKHTRSQMKNILKQK